MSLFTTLIEESVKNRNGVTLNQALTIMFPEKMEDKTFMIHEYDGDVPRLFGTDKTIELMIPNDMDTIVENAVVDAIKTGTLFDDAENVANTAKYITVTKLPTIGMINRGMNEPNALKYAIGSVVGGMNADGHFGRDESDIENGMNFTADCIDHGTEDNIHDLIGSYVNARDVDKLPIMFKKSTRGIDKDIENVHNVKPEDTISDEDIERGFHKTSDDDIEDFEDDVESKTESGGILGVDLASQVKAKLAETRAQSDAELDKIMADNDRDQAEIHKKAAEMKARIMARRNASNNVKECGGVCGVEEGDESQRSPETGVLPTDYWDEDGDTDYVDYSSETGGEMQSGETPTTPTSADDVDSSYNESYEEEVDQYTRYIQEGLFNRPKKLKPIPRDVVAYITVEMNDIKDANDQAMIAGYCCAKLELVDFYITCIDTKDDRYIVPHTREYLVQMQNDLNRLLTRILQIRPVNKNDRMWKAILPV